MAIGAISAPDSTSTIGTSPGNSSKSGKKELSDDEKQQVTELKKRDQEVKAHESAHIAAGGAYVRGGASYSYQSGPDGKRYAVGGEVSIDTSAISGDPDATIQKMRTVRNAALAPANPSGQDRSVASAASAVEAKAQQEKITEQKASQGQTGKKADIHPDKAPDSAPDSKQVVESVSCYSADGCSKSSKLQSKFLNLYI